MSPVLAHWSASWPVLAIYAGGGRRAPGRDAAAAGLAAPAGRRAAISEAAVFQGGLLLALLALVSPLGYWSGIYIWVRALQDLVAGRRGARADRARRAVAGPGEVRGPAADRPAAPDGPAAGPRRPWWLRWPLATVVAFNVIWLGWHLPALFDRVPASAAAAAARVRALPRRGDPVLAAAHRVAAVDAGGPAAAPGRRCWSAPWPRTPSSAWCWSSAPACSTRYYANSCASRDDRARRPAAGRRGPVDGHAAAHDRRPRWPCSYDG